MALGYILTEEYFATWSEIAASSVGPPSYIKLEYE